MIQSILCLQFIDIASKLFSLPNIINLKHIYHRFFVLWDIIKLFNHNIIIFHLSYQTYFNVIILLSFCSFEKLQHKSVLILLSNYSLFLNINEHVLIYHSLYTLISDYTLNIYTTIINFRFYNTFDVIECFILV